MYTHKGKLQPYSSILFSYDFKQMLNYGNIHMYKQLIRLNQDHVFIISHTLITEEITEVEDHMRQLGAIS